MNLYDVARTLPLFTALAWLSSVFLQLARLRVRTWTERFFVLGLAFSFLYSMNDWIFFNFTIGNDPAASALVLARLGMTHVTLAALFLLLFMKAFHSRAKPHDVAFLGPTTAMLVVCWTTLVSEVQPAPWGWKPIFDPSFFAIWVGYLLFYMGAGVRYIYHIASTLKKENPRIGRKTQRMLFLFIAMILMGASTNTLFVLIHLEAPPLYSSFLIFPAGALLFVLSPLTKDRIAVFIKRWKARAYEVRHVFLVYQNGTLIASKSEGDGAMIDKDIFAATLDAIQSFMRTSFPVLRGKWLKTIEHGDFRIILERGQRVYLAVVIAGEENDQLRRLMRDVITAVETQNQASLLDWSGMPEDIKGTKAAMGLLFKREDVF